MRFTELDMHTDSKGPTKYIFKKNVHSLNVQ